MSWQIFVLAIIFMVVVVPTILGTYYTHKNKLISGIDEDDRLRMDEVLESVDDLLDRIETLESILDDSHKNWRAQKEHRGDSDAS
ncbi:envelope stress response membrane protein PspB [Marinicellulosiphila megalodicopiae]|uniref:envelope stress response membrane protein PspB n=1 Tax=Marinicellulosiphila megalodicopiae TaxID=2724896 RepID=UPI003BAED9BF